MATCIYAPPAPSLRILALGGQRGEGRHQRPEAHLKESLDLVLEARLEERRAPGVSEP